MQCTTQTCRSERGQRDQLEKDSLLPANINSKHGSRLHMTTYWVLVLRHKFISAKYDDDSDSVAAEIEYEVWQCDGHGKTQTRRGLGTNKRWTPSQSSLDLELRRWAAHPRAAPGRPWMQGDYVCVSPSCQCHSLAARKLLNASNATLLSFSGMAKCG